MRSLVAILRLTLTLAGRSLPARPASQRSAYESGRLPEYWRRLRIGVHIVTIFTNRVSHLPHRSV